MFAQQVSRTVSSSTGNSISLPALSVAYTVGESIVFTGSSSGLIITQGFQQPDKDIITVIHSSEFLVDVNVFPNPVSDQLQIRINTDRILTDLSIEVEDMFGKLLKNVSVSASNSLDQAISLDFLNVSSGVYIVSVSSQKEQIHKAFKVIKK